MTKDINDILSINNNFDLAKKKRSEYLRNIMQHAINNTSFYSDLKGKSFSEFPVIDKQTILENYASLIVNHSTIPYQEGELHIQSTSGSTGIPLKIPQDTRCRERRIAGIKYGNQIIGHKEGEPIAHLRALSHYYQDKKEFILHNNTTNITYIDNSDLDELKIRKIINEINQRNIKLVRGYMTSLDLITTFAVNNNLFFSSKPIFISVGEPMLKSLRDRIVSKLKCDIITQYGNEENGIIGQSIINSDGEIISLNTGNLIIEILKFERDEPVREGEAGRIVVTDLFNYAFPMIRYDIGDIAKVGEIKDGIILSIKGLTGRKTDLIYKTNGEVVDMYNSMPTEIFNNPNISQWQFIQETKTKYILNINAKNKGKILVNKIKDDLHFLLGEDSLVYIKFGEEMPILSSGKRKVITSNLHNCKII